MLSLLLIVFACFLFAWVLAAWVLIRLFIAIMRVTFILALFVLGLIGDLIVGLVRRDRAAVAVVVPPMIEP